MLIIIIILLLLLFLFIGKKMINIFLIDKGDKIIEKITLLNEENFLKLDYIFDNWIKSLYANDLLSLLLPHNNENILVICSLTDKNNTSQILAVSLSILRKFLYNNESLVLFLKESPHKNFYLSCKINSSYFDISLKHPYFYDKENVFIVDNVKVLEKLFF